MGDFLEFPDVCQEVRGAMVGIKKIYTYIHTLHKIHTLHCSAVYPRNDLKYPYFIRLSMYGI